MYKRQAPAETTPAAKPATPGAEETIPAFDTVRVEKTGEAVIAGTAEAGSEVVVKLDGQTIGTATANGEGAFVVVPDAPLPSGSGALTIESKSKDDLQAVQSEQSVAVIIPAEQKQVALVAIVSPDAPTKVLQKPVPQPETEVAAVQPKAQPETPAVVPQTKPAAATAAKPVSIDAVDYDTAGNIVFSGQGQPGNTARVYVDNSHTGDAAIAADGRWSFSGTADIAAGQHSLRVDGIDAGGKVAFALSDDFCVDRHRADFLGLVDERVDLLFANAEEICSLYEVDHVEDAIEAVRGHCEIAVVTCSADGLSLIHI